MSLGSAEKASPVLVSHMISPGIIGDLAAGSRQVAIPVKIRGGETM
jgi:hypothetical protein